MGTTADAAQRVADELPRSVIGHVTAPVDMDQVGAHRRRLDQHVAHVAVHPDGVDVRMLEEEQVVVVGPRGDGPLQGPRLLVGQSAQPTDPHGRIGRRRTDDLATE